MPDDKKPGQDTPPTGDKSIENVLYGKPSTDAKTDDKKPEGKSDEKKVEDKPADEKKPIGEKPAETKKPEGDKPAPKADDKKADDAGEGEKKDEKKPAEGEDDKGKKDDAAKPESKVPEKYSLKRPDELWTDNDLAQVEAHARAMGLTQAQAEKELELQASYIAGLRSQLFDDLTADRELGGSKLQESVDVANKGLRAFLRDSPQEEQDAVIGLLQRTGYANHKALVRAFARLGRAAAEDKPDHSGKGGAGEKKTDAQMFYGRD